MLKGKRITKTWIFRSLLAVIICLSVIVGTLAPSVKSHAYENSYTNSETGYNVDIIDDIEQYQDCAFFAHQFFTGHAEDIHDNVENDQHQTVGDGCCFKRYRMQGR